MAATIPAISEVTERNSCTRLLRFLKPVNLVLVKRGPSGYVQTWLIEPEVSSTSATALALVPGSHAGDPC